MNTANAAVVSNNSDELVVNGGPSSMPEILEIGNDLDIAGAAGVVKDVLGCIGFNSDDDRRNFARFLVSGIIAYDVYDLDNEIMNSSRVSPPALMIIESSEPASGKTTVAKLFAKIFNNSDLFLSGDIGLDDIKCALSKGNGANRVCVFDNVRTLKDDASDLVSLAVISGKFSSRVLGSVNVSEFGIPIVVITALDSLKISEDLERRVVRVKLKKDGITRSIPELIDPVARYIRKALRTLVGDYIPNRFDGAFESTAMWKDKMDEFRKPVF